MRPRVAGVALTVFGLAAGLAAGQNQPPPPPIAVNYASGATDWVKGRNGQYLIVNSQCNGTNQSPLNIVDVHADVDGTAWTGPGSEFNAQFDPTMLAINAKYTPQTSWTLVARGYTPRIHPVNDHTVEVQFQDATTKFDGLTLPSGQFLQVKQFHFHSPSEHTVNGGAWPLEAHFVHNTNGTARGPNQLRTQIGVIGIFFALGETEDPIIASILAHVPKTDKVAEERTATGYLDAAVPVTDTLDVQGRWFASQDLGVYYAYSGSLTTPPCSEGLAWHVLPHPLSVTQAQLTAVTNLVAAAQGGLGRGSNYRPTQPQNGRLVRKSFQQHETRPDCEAIDFAEHVRPLQLGSIILAIALAVLVLVNVVGASVWYFERAHSIQEMRRTSVAEKGAGGGANAARKL